jgi:hypothetical protein
VRAETVCHTCSVTAPDPFVAPYRSFLLAEHADGAARGAAGLADDELSARVVGARHSV